MPGLQPGLTRKDTQHFPTLTIIYIPKALRHYIECQDFSLGEPKRIHHTFLDQLVNVKETKYGMYPRSTQAFNAECQDFSLGEQEKIHNISLY